MDFKTFFLTALFSIGLLVPSCYDDDDCGKSKPVPQFFDIEGMHLLNYKTTDEYACCGRTLVDSGAVVDADLFRLNIQFDVSYFGETSPVANPFSLGLMNSALACTPQPAGYNGSQEEIESLTIITLTDWDSLHVAGDTINDLLYVYDLGKRKKLEDFLHSNPFFIKEEQISMQLNSASYWSSSFMARVALKLKNGEEYTAESELVLVH